MESIIWSTGHQLKLPGIVKAENCLLTDNAGNQYVDLESGVWCTNIGHCHPEVNKVMQQQLNQITHSGFNYCHPVIEQAAKKVLEVNGMQGGKCEFLSSGSEAVEYAMRIARTLSVAPLALTFADSYFGAYGDAVIKSKEQWLVYNRLECSCSTHEGCVGECVEFKALPFEEIGIFLIEPGSSYGLVRFPSQKLIDAINNRLKKDSIIVVNEITTGAGRTGKWFGYQHYKLNPHIVAMGKGVGNGYPVSVVAVTASVAKALETKKFLYAQSHQNDPLGATVVKAVIEIIERDNLISRGNDLGEFLLHELNILARRYDLIKQVRGRGLMIALELHHSAAELHHQLFSKGYLTAKRSNGEALRIDPSLTIENHHLQNFVAALENCIKELSATY